MIYLEVGRIVRVLFTRTAVARDLERVYYSTKVRERMLCNIFRNREHLSPRTRIIVLYFLEAVIRLLWLQMAEAMPFSWLAVLQHCLLML